MRIINNLLHPSFCFSIITLEKRTYFHSNTNKFRDRYQKLSQTWKMSREQRSPLPGQFVFNHLSPGIPAVTIRVIVYEGCWHHNYNTLSLDITGYVIESVITFRMREISVTFLLTEDDLFQNIYFKYIKCSSTNAGKMYYAFH